MAVTSILVQAGYFPSVPPTTLPGAILRTDIKDSRDDLLCSEMIQQESPTDFAA